MKARKLCYNEETKKMDYVEFDISNKLDFSNDPKTNYVESDDGHSIEPFVEFQRYLVGFNKEIELGETTIHKCIDCQRYFPITIGERRWFEDRDLKLPKRCVPCRKKKKGSKI